VRSARFGAGTHPDDGQPFEVVDGPPEGARVPSFREVPAEFAPGIEAGLLSELAAKLKGWCHPPKARIGPVCQC
jgi:Mn-containing catalase